MPTSIRTIKQGHVTFCGMALVFFDIFLANLTDNA